MQDRSNNQAKTIKAVILTAIAIISFFLLSNVFTSNAFVKDKVDYLDEKKTTVLKITAASTAASAAISMIPGDTGTPIAEKLADISGYSIVILCAVFLEKYLVTITALAAFKVLIPIACLILLINMYFVKKDSMYQMGKKLIAFAIAIFLLIPVSIQISKTIEDTYQDSIQETIDNAEKSSEEIQNNAMDSSGKTDESLWDQFISGISGGVSTITQNFENILNNFIESIAVMIVTSCLIPIAVLLLMVWIFKFIFKVDTTIPYDQLLRINHGRQ